MKNVFLQTENVRRFQEAADVLADIEKGQPGLCVVYGRAGRGKTECSREFAVRTGSLYIRVMEDWTPRAMLASLCFEINGSRPSSVDRCKSLLFSALDQNPRTILVDEADRFKNIGMIEHFRDIHDMTGSPVILIGEQSLYAKISTKRRLWSRITQTVEFGPISTEDILVFGMKAAELKIAPDAAQMIGKRSEGDFRLIWQDVRALEQMARAAGTLQVDTAMVKELKNRKPSPTR